jgi:hypothetical protein
VRLRGYLGGEPRLVRRVLLAAGVQFAAGLAAGLAWLITGDPAWIRFYFLYLGPVFLAGLAALELTLGLTAWGYFAAGDPLRQAWLLASLAAACRLAGLLASQWLAAEPSLLLRRLWLNTWDPIAVLAFPRLGLTPGGQAAMAVLCLGLLVVIYAYRRHRLRGELGPLEWVVVCAAALFPLLELRDASSWVGGPLSTPAPFKVLSLVAAPLSALSLYVALLLRRSSVNMHGGLIARCWGSYSLGIFATVCGNLGVWAIAHGHLPWSARVLVALVWYVSAIAYALGPACQVTAIRRARRAALELSGAEAGTE